VPDLPAISEVRASAYTVPTDAPEADGTFAWDSTTIVIVELRAGDQCGMGYSYASRAAASVVIAALAQDVVGSDPADIPAISLAMSRRLRNAGRPGIGATAISAVDNALWDLKARLLGVSFLDLVGAARPSVPGYGSGGFTSYSDEQLSNQLGGWANDGFAMVKMKIGTDAGRDPARVKAARAAVGSGVELFVDANGAYDARQAVRAANTWLADERVTWFEEPVTSDDLAGLRFVRDHTPAEMAVAAGEYGWTPIDFVRLADGPAVDTIQIDATRCLGVSGFLAAAALCRSGGIPISTHCAPSLHSHLACAVNGVRHIEWFHDHVRIEQALFDGSACARDGMVTPDRGRPGFGLELRRADARQFLVWEGSTANDNGDNGRNSAQAT
jgi:L-alanine-DL-glutamate epimerase-like enolase superfamily enzyme